MALDPASIRVSSVASMLSKYFLACKLNSSPRPIIESISLIIPCVRSESAMTLRPAKFTCPSHYVVVGPLCSRRLASYLPVIRHNVEQPNVKIRSRSFSFQLHQQRPTAVLCAKEVAAATRSSRRSISRRSTNWRGPRARSAGAPRSPTALGSSRPASIWIRHAPC